MFLLSLAFILFSTYFLTSVIMKNIKCPRKFCDKQNEVRCEQNFGVVTLKGEQQVGLRGARRAGCDTRLDIKDMGVIIFPLIAFSQIVLTFEILSLFSKISQSYFLIFNSIFLIISIALWIYQKYPLYKPDIKNEFNRIKKALFKDKLLFFIAVCFLIFLIFTFLSAVLLPVDNGDALTYYFSRGVMWIQNGNINHFLTSDIRELVMPVNMDLLYSYLFLFTKNDKAVAIIPFIFFLIFLMVLYNFLKEMGFSVRKRLWAVFSFSSFCLVGVMAKSPSSDIAIGALLLMSVYLMFLYVKEEKFIILFLSALSLSLSFGVKTPAFIAFPSVLILVFIIIFLFKKEMLKKTILTYLLLIFANFCIFSAYNYVLNYLQFGNFLSSQQFAVENRFNADILGYLTNLSKSFLMFFDASGLSHFEVYNNLLNNISAHINFSKYTYIFPTEFKFNSNVEIMSSGLGILGLFLFLTSLCISFVRLFYFKHIKSKKKLLICIFGLCFIFNFFLFCYLMVYTSFNMRYFITFICLSSPILVLSYIKSNRNIVKYVFCYFMFIYLVIVANKQISMFMLNYVYTKATHPEIHNTYELISRLYNFGEEDIIFEYFKRKNNPNITIAEIASAHNHYVFNFEKLSLYGYKIDKLIVPSLTNNELQKYDYLISNTYKIDSQTDEKLDEINSNPPFNCKYIAINLKETDDFKKSISTTCDIPFEYYSQLGFEKVEDLKLSKYFVYKNKNAKN